MAWVVDSRGQAYQYDTKTGKATQRVNTRAQRQQVDARDMNDHVLSTRRKLLSEYGTTNSGRIRVIQNGGARTAEENEARTAERRARRAEYGTVDDRRISELISGGQMTTAERGQRERERERQAQRERERTANIDADARQIRAASARNDRVNGRDEWGRTPAEQAEATRRHNEYQRSLRTNSDTEAIAKIEEAIRAGDFTRARGIHDDRKSLVIPGVANTPERRRLNQVHDMFVNVKDHEGLHRTVMSYAKGLAERRSGARIEESMQLVRWLLTVLPPEHPRRVDASRVLYALQQRGNAA